MSNWPGTAGLPAVPTRAGYSRKSIQLPIAADNGETDAPEMLWGTGSPNGAVTGTVGDSYTQTDGLGLWLKTSGTATNTGWTYVGNLANGMVSPLELGAAGNGSTVDTTAVQAAITAATAKGAALLLPDGYTFLVDQLTVGTALRIVGGGTLKIHSTFSIATADGVVYCTAPVIVDGPTIDGNSKGRAGINFAGSAAGSVIRHLTVQNITDASDSGSVSGVMTSVPITVHSLVGSNLVWTNAQSNASMPRLITFNSGADGSVCRGLRGSTVNVIAVVQATRVSIFDTVIDGAAGDGFYCLSGSDNVLIDGGQLRNVANMTVFEGVAPTIRNITHIVDATVTNGNCGVNLDGSPSNVVVDNIRIYAPTKVANLVAARSGLGTVSGLRIQGCHFIGGVDSSAPIALSHGTVNGLKVIDNYLECHQLAAIVGEGRFVTHSAGDSVFYNGNIWKIVDDEGTLTSSNTFRLIIPTLSAISYWGPGNLFVTDPSHAAVCLLAIGVAHLNVDGGLLPFHSTEGSLHELGYNSVAAIKRVTGDSYPTAGTWEVGDFVWNEAPAEVGSGGSKYVVLGWTCTVAGTSGTWLPCRCLTGN